MAEGPQPPQLPEPNPITMQAHRRQIFWQIKFPIFVSLFVVLLAGAGVIWTAATGGGESVSRWSDISVMWLVAPMLLLTLIMIAVLAAIVYGFSRMLPVIPRYTHLLLGYFMLISRRVERISNAAVEPFLRVHSVSASLRALQRAIRGKSG